jgi:hypothetical protein
MPPKKTPTKKSSLNESLDELDISSNQPKLGYLYGRGSIGARFYKTVRIFNF